MAKSETVRGTCPCCFRIQAEVGGRTSKHGYTAPGRGTGYAPHRGSGCLGRAYPLLDKSPEGTLAVLTIAKKDLETATAWLATLSLPTDAGGPTTLTLMRGPTRNEVQTGKYRRFASIPEQVTPETVSAWGEPWERVTWAALVKLHVAKTETRIRAIRDFRATATEALLKFHPDCADSPVAA